MRNKDRTQDKADAVTLASLPRSIEEANGDLRAFSKADMRRRVARAPCGEPGSETPSSDVARSRANMEALVRSRGLEPVKRHPMGSI